MFTISKATVTPPSITNPGDQTNSEDESVNLPILASPANGGTLVYSASGLPAGLSIDPSTGVISGQLESHSSGTYNVNVTVTEDSSGQASEPFVWTVIKVNDAPVIDSSPFDQTNNEGDAANLAVSASDLDQELLTYSASGLPDGITINSSTGFISGTLTLDSAGDYSVVLTVSDGLLSDFANFNWTVNNIGQPQVSPSSLTVNVQTTGKGKNKTKTVTVNWTDNSFDEDGFVLQRCKQTGKGKSKQCSLTDCVSLVANVTSYIEPENLSGVYGYRVRAYNSVGNSVYSNTVKVRL